MAPTLVQKYTSVQGRNTTANSSGSFTASAGEVIVVKLTCESASTPLNGAPTATGLTFTSRVTSGSGGSQSYTAIYTAVVPAGGGTYTVTASAPASNRSHSMVVERWSSAQLATTPATGSVAANTSCSCSITTAASDSVVSWVSADWNAVSYGTRTYRSSATEELVAGTAGSDYFAAFAYQSAASAGSQTFGMTAPTGQQASMTGIEIQAAGGTDATATPSAIAAVASVGSPRINAIAGDLKNWRTAYDGYLAGTGTAKIVVMGDSIAEGMGVSGSTMTNRWQGKMQAELRRSAGGLGYISAGYVGGGLVAQDVDYRSSGTYSDTQQHGYGGKGAIVPGGGVVYFPSTTCDRIRLYYGPDIFQGWMDVCEDGATSLITNGDFETDTSSWGGNPIGYDAATLSRDTTQHYTGSASMRVDWAATTGPGMTYQGISTTSGKRYTLSAKVYVPSGQPDVVASEYGGPAGAVITTKDAWVETHYSWSETSTGTRFVGIVKPTGEASGGYCYVDDVKVQETLYSVDTNGSGSEQVWDSGSLSSATRQIVVRNSANPNFNIRVTGAEFFNGDYSNHLSVFDASFSGSNTDYHANLLGMGTYDNMAIDQPDLVIVALGNNDAYTLSAATYKANLQTIVDRVNTEVTSNHSILLIAPYYDARNDTLVEAWANYTTAVQQVAESNPNVGWYSAQDYWPTLVTDGSANGGLMYEATYPLHPNDTGHQKLADVAYTALFGIDPPYPATAVPAAIAGVAGVGTPTITTGETAQPAAVAAVAAVPAPTIKTSSTVAVSTVSAVAAVGSATVTSSTNATVSATAVAAVTAVGSPTITASSIPKPAAVAAIASVGAPSIKTGETAKPSAVAAVAAVGAPTITATSLVQPSAVSAVASVGAPAVSTGSKVTPAAVAAVAAVPAPAIQTAGNATVGATTVAAVAAVGSPTVSTSSNTVVTPSSVTAVAAVPAPATGAGATVLPATTAATASVGSPTVNTSSGSAQDATVTPNTVVATAAIPSPTVTTGTMVSPTVVGGVVSVNDVSLTLLNTHYYFSPPTVREKYERNYARTGDRRLWMKVSFQTGETVLKSSGFYTLHPEIVSDEQIAAADVAYLAGHEYLISDAERSDLIAAGYGSYITSRLE